MNPHIFRAYDIGALQYLRAFLAGSGRPLPCSGKTVSNQASARQGVATRPAQSQNRWLPHPLNAEFTSDSTLDHSIVFGCSKLISEAETMK
jgi:hypothetical protein